MRRATLPSLLLAVPALLLGAAAAPAADASCEASAGAAWTAAGPAVRILARTFGPGCGEAVAVIVVRDGARLLYQRALPAAQVMTLAGAGNAAAMKAALAEWVDPSAGLVRTGQLPDWAEGADAPEAGEFPFYPAQGADRAFHMEWRAADAPMFCHVQGMESASCLAIRDGAVTELGVQSFPG